MQHGCNLADAIRRALDLGISVQPVRRTGELRFTYPLLPDRPRVNGRRKDAPRALTDFVTRVERLRE